MAKLLAPELLLLLVVAMFFVVRAYLRRSAPPRRWLVRQRALREGGFVIELVCPGEHPQEVRRLPPGLPSEALGDELAEAVSEAEARAATLNAMRPR
jgi:hypothetical protein